MAVRIEKSGPVWTIVNSRPETRNAVDPATAEALHRVFLDFEGESSASVAILWGEGGAFCSGYDLKVASDLGADILDDHAFPDSTGRREYIPPGPMGPTSLELGKPIIAAIAGPAVAGGMELALWCDLRVMEESSYMGVYSRRWGIPLVDGGTVRLPRLVGEGRALDLVLTGRQVHAEECHRIGLADYVVADGTSREKAEELAQALAAFPQGASRSDRQSVKSQHGLPLLEAMAREWSISAPVFSAEGANGAARFRDGAGRHGELGQG